MSFVGIRLCRVVALFVLVSRRATGLRAAVARVEPFSRLYAPYDPVDGMYGYGCTYYGNGYVLPACHRSHDIR